MGFKLIGITTPGRWPDAAEESSVIKDYLLSNALDIIHIRKPEATLDYVVGLMDAIPQNLHCRLVLHSHYQLSDCYKFYGIHLKKDFNVPKIKKYISRSCHSLKECSLDSELFVYSFLSPIFDSISKTGYNSRFDISSSQVKAVTARIPLVALGGVTPDKFQQIFDAKFVGAALLGYLWSPKTDVSAKIELIKAEKLKLM